MKFVGLFLGVIIVALAVSLLFGWIVMITAGGLRSHLALLGLRGLVVPGDNPDGWKISGTIGVK